MLRELLPTVSDPRPRRARRRGGAWLPVRESVSNDGSCPGVWSARSPVVLGAQVGSLGGAFRHEGLPVLCRAHPGGGREVQVLRLGLVLTRRTAVPRTPRR